MTQITNTGRSPALGGIGRVLAHREFRLYTIGNLLSLVGAWIHRMALGWYTWELTHSSAWLGTIAFCALVPPIILGPISGTLADRVGSRRTAQVAMLLEAANTVLLMSLIATDLTTVHLLVPIALMQGIFFSFDLPVRAALVPDIVPRADLSAAIGVNTASFHMTSFIGPVIGGFVIAHWGVAPAFAFNAVAFVVFFAILRRMKVQHESRTGTEGRSFGADMLEGFQYTFGHPALRTIMLIGVMTHVCMRPYYDMLPAFADRVFDRKIDGLTVLAAASGLGGLAGGVTLAIRARLQGLTRNLIWAQSGSAFLLMAFALVGHIWGPPAFWVATAILVPVGIGLVMSGIASQSLVQNMCDPTKRARVVGLSTSFAIGGPALGALIQGALGEVFGMGPPLAVTSLLTGLTVLLYAPALRRMRSDMESDRPAAAWATRN